MGNLPPPDVKSNYKAIVIVTRCRYYDDQLKDPWNTTQSLETVLYVYGHLTYDRGSIKSTGRMDYSINAFETLDM